MDRRCTEEIFELSNFSICSPSLAPQISAARNSFKHDKDYYEGLLEYYRHSSIQLSRFILLHILKWNYRFDMFVTPLSPDFVLLFLVPLVSNIWNKESVCWCLQSTQSLHAEQGGSQVLPAGGHIKNVCCWCSGQRPGGCELELETKVRKDLSFTTY